MSPEACPRFDTCNAAVCPLAPSEGVHLKGEPVCYYLLASGKAGADEKFASDPVYATCRQNLPILCDRYSDIRKRIERASRSGFKSDNLNG